MLESISSIFYPPRDPNFNENVIVFVVGISLLAAGLLMIKFDASRRRRELEKGELKATGVFWNPKTKERLEGIFHFKIDSGAKMDSSGFRHKCHGIQHIRTQTGIATVESPTDNPVLTLIFEWRGWIKKGEFAGSIFNSLSNDLDMIVFTRGTIMRFIRKADPCCICSEIGSS